MSLPCFHFFKLGNNLTICLFPVYVSTHNICTALYEDRPLLVC